MLQTLINRLISQPPRLLLWKSSGIVSNAEGSGKQILLVSRAKCHYHLFVPIDGGNSTKTKAALALMIRNWAPFKDHEYVAVESGAGFMVWAWSRTEAMRALAQAGIKTPRILCLPEALFAPREPDGVLLRPCLDGIEAQNWQKGVLKDSRWWPDVPNRSEWLAFQRAASVKPAALTGNVPLIHPVKLLEKPWGGIGSSALTIFGRLSPMEIGLGAAFAASLPLIFLSAEYIRIGRDLGRIDRKLTSLQLSAGPILDAREKALGELDRVKALLALDPYPPQIRIMARASSLIVANGTRIIDWNYQRGDLDIGLQAPNGLDARDYVERFELAGPFKDVTVDRNNAQITFLRMKVKTLTESAQKAAIVPNNALPPAAAAPLPPSPFGATDLPAPAPEGPPRSENPAIK